MSRRQPTRQNAGLFKGEQLSAWARAAEGYREAVSRGLSRRVIAEGHREAVLRRYWAGHKGCCVVWKSWMKGGGRLDESWVMVGMGVVGWVDDFSCQSELVRAGEYPIKGGSGR